VTTPVKALTAAEDSTVLAAERTFLAHERTLLAWLRTAISLMSFGFSIQQFFRVARANAPPDDRLIGPEEFGFLMMLVGLLSLLFAIYQYRLDVAALQKRYIEPMGVKPLPISRTSFAAVLVALLGILGLLSMFLRR
jgi:putative membrane protein